MEYIYGKNTVLAFLSNGKVLEVFLQENIKDETLINSLKKRQIKYSFKSKEYLDRITTSNKHQGIVASIDSFKYANFEQMLNKALKKQYPFILMLDGVEDPHNFGAIIRSAEAFGVDGIIIGKHNSVSLNSTVAKVSTGAIANIDICEVTNLTKTLKDLKEKGFWVFAAEAEQGQDYNIVDYKLPIVLVVGSEGKGISRLVKENSDFNIYIPMTGKVNSLNVSVATAILLAKMTQK